MKKYILVFVLCCLMTISVWAAKKVDFYKSNANGYIKQLNQQGLAGGSVFGLEQGEDLQLISSHMDFNGVTHERYQQTYQGIPVWGLQTIISKDHSNKVIKLHGNLTQGIPGDVGGVPASLDPAGALDKIKNEHKKKDAAAKWNFENEEYGTYIFIDEKGKAHLAYVVSFFADTDNGNPSRPVNFIDAKNGKVLYSYDNLQYADGTGPGGNQKIGQYYYGSTYPAFGVTANGSTCTMNTTDVKTVNLNHGTSGSTAYSYTCYENTYKAINGAYCPLNDAQFFGQVVYDMYQAWYSLPVLPFQLMMRVHYSTNYENAFWNGSSMTFGDGYNTFYPLVALDVSAHEVAHGFTSSHSNLTYSGQSGGINEAYSDMAGEAAKYYMRGTNDFKVGYDIFKSANGALRYMYNPPLDGRSIDHVSEYYAGLDVHYSSGVFNKAFWALATTSGWDTQMAFDVFTKANVDYWSSGTNFQQGGEGVQDAAADYMYDCQDVADAFAVVGVTLSCGGGGTDTITVVSPNGGESWNAGSTHAITWTSTGTLTDVKISYSINNGGSWTTVIASTPNDGSYNWTIPSQSKTQRRCLVQVASLDGTVSDTSDSKFRINK